MAIRDRQSPARMIGQLADRAAGAPEGGGPWNWRGHVPGPHAPLALDLLRATDTRIAKQVTAFAAARDTDTRVAASLVWKAYCRWLVLPAVAGWAAYRRVPDLAADAVRVRFESPGRVTFALAEPRVAVLPDDPDADAPDAVVAADEDELLQFLMHRLLDDHLAPMLLRFRDIGGLSNRIPWGSVAVAFTQPFEALTRLLSRDFSPEIDRLLAELGPVGKLVSMTEAVNSGGECAPRPLRRTCCQKMRLPEAKNCANCPLLSERARAEVAAGKGFSWIRDHCSVEPVGEVVTGE